ncbi:MAG: hypothetical protein IPH88_00675 [Bacteroidales bacterium]|nr:hypothetical protein [Bacteroidales bacterium]
MKKTAIIVGILLCFALVPAIAQKTGKITVKSQFKGIVEGYDHTCKTQLFVDGRLVASSEEGLESKPSSFSAVVPRGRHDIKIVNYAFYEGNWEEHTKENNYSIDASYEGSVNLKKKLTITLVFDIDKEETQVKVK